LRSLDAQRIERKIRGLADSTYATMAGEAFSKVAAVFEVSRSAVYRHRKHFTERILVDRKGARKIMDEVRESADKCNPR
jgi:hypothetical protein